MYWFLEKIKQYGINIPKLQTFRPGEIVRLEKDFNEDSFCLLFSVLNSNAIFCPFNNENIDFNINLEGPGFILSSSGTTGNPKFVLYSFDKFLGKFTDAPFNPIKTIMIMDVGHIGGMDVLFSILSRGGSVIFPREKTPNEICKLISENDIKVISISPSFLNLILISNAHKEYDLSSLKTVNFGAEVMPSFLLERLKSEFPNIEFKQTFGTTETGTLQIKRHPTDPLLIKIPDSKIIEKKLYVKSNHGMIGYLNEKNPTTLDGYFPTGDLVEEYENGFIKILGRITDNVNIGGEKVSLNEVENFILQVPYVKDVLAKSEKNSILGNILVIEVVWTGTENCKKYIINYLKNIGVDKHKIPSKIKTIDNINITDRLKKKRI